jgi:uncharacterized protein (TIGR00661 family)
MFALAGAGAGNSSRFAALVEALDPDRFEIALIAGNQACRLAPPGVRTHALKALTYGRGAFTAWSIVRHNWSFPARFLENRRVCARALDDMKPDVVVVDSDIHCLLPARRRRVPIVSVNSSPATVQLFSGMQDRPAGMAFSYHCIERMDRWLQLRFAGLIVCPVIVPVDIGLSTVRQVPPIVRRQFLECQAEGQTDRARYDVAVMLGGSGIGTAEIDLRDVKGSMVIIGAETDGRFPASAERVPFTSEPARYLAAARVVVIQAGFNSLSEVIALRKLAVIVPIPHHAEQFVNARTAGRIGIGRIARGDRVAAAVTALLDDEASAQWRRPPALPCDGAEQAARLIEGVLGG